MSRRIRAVLPMPEDLGAVKRRGQEIRVRLTPRFVRSSTSNLRVTPVILRSTPEFRSPLERTICAPLGAMRLSRNTCKHGPLDEPQTHEIRLWKAVTVGRFESGRNSQGGKAFVETGSAEWPHVFVSSPARTSRRVAASRRWVCCRPRSSRRCRKVLDEDVETAHEEVREAAPVDLPQGIPDTMNACPSRLASLDVRTGG